MLEDAAAVQFLVKSQQPISKLLHQSASKRKDLTLKEKYEVVIFQKHNPKVGIRKLAMQFKCGKTQIAETLKKKAEITSLYCEQNASSDV